MGQTRMFRDRVVSMEQTLEGGEKHLPLLKEICREAFPELEFREHALDHERDLFAMDYVAAGGAKTRVSWTRMVLYDAERIPTLTGDPAAALRSKIVEFLRAHAGQPEILVTFRHLEDGWVDTPEPKREGRRRRRGGHGGARGQERGGPEKRPGGPSAGGPAQRGPSQRPSGQRPQGQRPQGRRPQGQGQRPPGQRGPAPGGPVPRGPTQPRPQPAGEPRVGAEGGQGQGLAGSGRRRRRRRRGRGPGGPPPAPGGAPVPKP